MDTLTYVFNAIATLGVLLMPVISGPVACVIFIALVKKQATWLLALFWFVLFLVDIAAFPAMACAFGHSFPGPGFMAWKCLPGSALASLITLVVLGWKVWHSPQGTRQTRVWLLVGVVVVPSLQLGTEMVFPYVMEPLWRWLFGLGFPC
jgi:hypothetical protein